MHLSITFENVFDVCKNVLVFGRGISKNYFWTFKCPKMSEHIYVSFLLFVYTYVSI